MQVKIKKLSAGAVTPRYSTEGSACFDLFVPLGDFPRNLNPGETVVINTALSVEIPEGHVMLVFSRSGHGFKNNVRLGNCVGVIDADYRGPLAVKLTGDIDMGLSLSANSKSLLIQGGDRIAQAMVIPYPRVEFVEVDELGATERGEGGFGSTGA